MVNIVTVCFAMVVLVFYDFPTTMPVTGSNMSKLLDFWTFWILVAKTAVDYSSAVLGVMAIFAVLNWIIHARKEYQGPRLRRASDMVK